MFRLSYAEIVNTLKEKLLQRNFEENRAREIAEIFTTNSLEGVYSHGINRFTRFLEYVDKNLVAPKASPIIKSKHKGIQQWDGQLGAGISNAIMAVNGAMQLSNHYGIGCVALANTNHWMRGGTYGRMAAEKGHMFIGWTNTIANLPAWGALDRRLGNNPLVIAVPSEPIVVIDMAMSQFSYGKLEDKSRLEKELEIPGGFDLEGQLSVQPKEILKSGRPLPIGYWKGAGLSLLLDLMAAILSDGKSTFELSQSGYEYGVSQVFICISPEKLEKSRSINETVTMIIEDYKASVPDRDAAVIYPGERTVKIVAKNTKEGIPIDKEVWETIISS